MRAWLRAIRVHHWGKNLLVFVPLALAHRLDADAMRLLALTFAAFSLIASASYLLNDLLDIKWDREHPSKRARPIAAGELRPTQAMVVSGLLAMCGAALGAILDPGTQLSLLAYLVFTPLYSLYLKRIAALDVAVLAGFHTLRLIAGGTAAQVRLSPWLFQFSLFLFASLALAKRYTELLRLSGSGEVKENGARGYRRADLSLVGQAGVGCGLISVLVLALYCNSADVGALYSHPLVLGAVCPVFLYWILRVWILAHRGEMHDDPLVFAFRDPISYGSAAAIVAIALAASMRH